MKYVFTLISICFLNMQIYSQCTPNSSYLDSLPGIYPASASYSTTLGLSFYEELDIHVPSTLIEATNGDSSQLIVDTLGQTIYVGNLSIDSMKIIEIQNLPPGINFSCNISNCMFNGGEVGCVELSGIAQDTGIFNPTPIINYYISGVISINAGGVPLIYPVEFDYFSYFGEYVTISGYIINVLNTTSISSINNHIEISSIYSDSQEIIIGIKSNNRHKSLITITDMKGRIVYDHLINIEEGEKEYFIKKSIDSGLYILNINNQNAVCKFFVTHPEY